MSGPRIPKGHGSTRRPIVASVIVAMMLGVLWWSIPGGLVAMRAAQWHPESVLAVAGAHLLFLGAFGWIAWMFWVGRRPGDGG